MAYKPPYKTPMEQLIKVERDGPPTPAPEKRRRGPAKVFYDFNLIPVGGSARVPRSVGTVRNQIYRHYKANPGQQLVARAITPTLTRVWRTK